MNAEEHIIKELSNKKVTRKDIATLYFYCLTDGRTEDIDFTI